MSSVKNTYSVVQGFFVQDDSPGFQPLPPRFGLIDDSSDRWQIFQERLGKLNTEAQPGTSYKAIFVGRHGEGWHNVAIAKYDHQIWESQLCKQTGDDSIVWGPDPLLTPVGEAQANEVLAMWKQERTAGIPLPTKLYCSPLTRTLMTCLITFDPILDFSSKAPFARGKPLVVENCREKYGIGLCDKRSTRSYIMSTFGDKFDIEEDLTEEDKLFEPDVRETIDHVVERARHVLDLIFTGDSDDTVVSITAHHAWIDGLLAVTNHCAYNLPPGGVLPMVIKCTFQK